MRTASKSKPIKPRISRNSVRASNSLRSNWSEPERWAWDRLCKGLVANFNERNEPYSKLDPAEPSTWKAADRKERTLRAAFLSSICLDERLYGQFPHGIRISGAWLEEKLDLHSAELRFEWWLDDSLVNADINLTNIKSRELVSLEGSAIQGSILLERAKLDTVLNLMRVRCEKALAMQGSYIGNLLSISDSHFNSIELSEARVAGIVDMRGINVKDKLDMQSIDVAKNILLHDKASIGNINLMNATVGESIYLDGIQVSNTMDFNSISVAKNIMAREGAKFGDIDLISATIGQHVHLIGCTCNGKLEMVSAHIGGGLNLADGKYSKEVDLAGATVEGGIKATKAEFEGHFSINSARIGANVIWRGLKSTASIEANFAAIEGSLDLRPRIALDGKAARTQIESIDLSDARISHHLLIDGICIRNKLSMTRTSTLGCIFGGPWVNDHNEVIAECEIGSIEAPYSDIKKLVSLNGVKCTGAINLHSAQIGQSLRIGNRNDSSNTRLLRQASAKGLIANNACIGETLDLSGLQLSNQLGLERVRVGSDCFLGNAVLDAGVDLGFSHINGVLRLSGAKLSQVNLTNTIIGDELELGTAKQSPPEWIEKTDAAGRPSKSRLTLINAKVGTIESAQADAAWPAELRLNGFTYRNLGGLHSDTEGTNISNRKLKWYLAWIEKDKTRSWRPYQQLATILLSMGYDSKAIALQYAARNREKLDKETPLLRRISLTILCMTIGYGYGYRIFRSLFFVLYFTFLGGLAYTTTSYSASLLNPENYIVSLCQLLPIVTLDKHFSELTFQSWQQYYFYGHKIVGYILGGFIVAGLSGLTKRQTV